MVKIYCGLEEKLDDENYDRIGTRYECLRKGIGVGLYKIRKKKKSSKKYRPDGSYCGNKTQLPRGYTHFGSPYSCLRKGIGVAIYKIE